MVPSKKWFNIVHTRINLQSMFFLNFEQSGTNLKVTS